MPARYNSRASSMYRYNEPTISQYESFFNPIPLEFVQEQFDRRQGAYDEAYAGAMQAKDQFNNAKVGAPDIQYAKQLTNQFVEDTDKMVQEQFGGDWGKAAKTIARNVTNVRGNEFWQKAEILDKRREEERALTSKYGPNALVFKSVQNKSVYDPTTKQMINPESMSYDVLEKGDWNKTIQDVIGKINPDSNPYGLTRADFGYLRSGQITEISSDKLKKIAEDPNIQQAIISAHPEMARAFNELPDKRESLFGDAPDLRQAVQSMISGNIGSQQFKQKEEKYVQDWQLKAEQEAAAEAAKVDGQSTSITTPIEGSGYRGVPKINDSWFKNGVLTVPTRELQQTSVPFTGAGFTDNNSGGANKYVNIINQIKKENPGIVNYSKADGSQGVRNDQEIYKIKRSADEKLAQQTGKIWTISPDWQEAQTRSMIMNDGTLGPIFNQELYVDGKHISGEKKVKMFQEELGIKNDSELKEVLKSARVQGINYTGRTPGELTINVIGKDGKPHTVEMSPNDQMQSVATPVYMLSEIIRTNGTSGDINRFSVNGESATQTDDGAWIVPSGSEVQGKKIYYIVNSQIDVRGAGKEISGSYNPTIYLIDQDGNLFKDEEGNPVTEDLTNIVKHTENSIKKFGVSYTNKNKQTVSQN